MGHFPFRFCLFAATVLLSNVASDSSTVAVISSSAVKTSKASSDLADSVSVSVTNGLSNASASSLENNVPSSSSGVEVLAVTPSSVVGQSVTPSSAHVGESSVTPSAVDQSSVIPSSAHVGQSSVTPLAIDQSSVTPSSARVGQSSPTAAPSSVSVIQTGSSYLSLIQSSMSTAGVGAEDSSTVAATATLDAAPSVSVSQFQASQSSQPAAEATSNSIAGSQVLASASVSQAPSSQAVAPTTASSNASSKAVDQPTPKPTTVTPAIKPSTAGNVMPSSSVSADKRLSCYTCSYNSTGFCDSKKTTCVYAANEIAYCLDYHITYKNKTEHHGKGCGKTTDCKDIKAGCQSRNQTGDVKACDLECCKSDDCNPVSPSKASRLLCQLTFFLSFFAFICLLA